MAMSILIVNITNPPSLTIYSKQSVRLRCDIVVALLDVPGVFMPVAVEDAQLGSCTECTGAPSPDAPLFLITRL